jgi:phosphatidylserine/phosphatidylglycerophosphate/cardiolipin synthase-like enzyme
MIFGAGLAAGALLVLLAQQFFLAPAISPVFSPEQGGEIIGFIDSAEETLDIEVYILSSRDVVAALERAKARGVEIRIIVERNVVSGENDEIYRELASKGFNIRFAGSAQKLTHSKFIIVDGKAVLVGSHNLSNSALFKNREASVIIRDSATVNKFGQIFETDWATAN